MAKGMYAAVGGSTKKIKKNYAVVDGKTRKIKRMYAVVNGVTRLIFSGGGAELVSKGTADVQQTFYYSSASIGNYALFHPGYSSIYAVNTSLTVDSSARMTQGGTICTAATTVGNYAVFSGGYGGDDMGQHYSNVDAFNSSLTKTQATALNNARRDHGAATVGSYAIFTGGILYGSTCLTNTEAYNSSLTKQSTVTLLNKARYCMSTATVGNYAIFAGGAYQTADAGTVETYNTSLTRGTATALADSRNGSISSAAVGGYALFAGGTKVNNSSFLTTVEAYNSSLTKSTATALSIARGNSCHLGDSVGEVAVFGGGCNSTAIDIYDSSLTRTNNATLSKTWRSHTRSVGNLVMFGGGNTGIEVFQAS